MTIFLISLIVFYSGCFFSSTHFGDAYYVAIPIVYWVVTLLYLYKYKKSNLFCFETLFAISFYLCSFLTLYLLPFMDSYEARAFIDDERLIYRSYTISIIGYLCYLLGLIIWEKKSHVEESSPIHFNKISRRTSLFADLLCTFFIFLLFLNGGSRLFSMYSDTNLYSSERLSGFAAYLTFAVITYVVSIATNFASLPDSRSIFSIPLFKSFSFLFLFNSVILIGTFLISGYRSNAIQVLIPLVLAYQIKFKPLKPLTVIALIGLGALFMFFIGVTRTGSSFDTNGYTALTYLRDFKPSNAATIFFVDYVDSRGTTGGSNFLFPLLSIIPGLQSVTSLFVDIHDMAPVSSELFTNAFSSNSGFGTNIIGDLYYSFGYLGVVILMFLYGSFLYKVSHAKNSYEIAMFLFFSGNAMFAPRVEYCYIIRSIAWSVIFLFLIRLIPSTTRR